MNEKKEEKTTTGAIKDKVKKIKHKEIIIAGLAVIIMLIIYFTTLGGGNSSSKSTKSDTADYCAKMKSQIQTAVNKISGDTDSSVLVNWESGVETIIAYITSENGTSSSSSPQIVNGGPVVLKELYPKANSVVIVCKNGSNAKVKVEITLMISTLLGISTENIEVFNQN